MRERPTTFALFPREVTTRAASKQTRQFAMLSSSSLRASASARSLVVGFSVDSAAAVTEASNVTDETKYGR